MNQKIKKEKLRLVRQYITELCNKLSIRNSYKIDLQCVKCFDDESVEPDGATINLSDDNEPYFTNVTLTVCIKTLNRPNDEIREVILHELLHLKLWDYTATQKLFIKKMIGFYEEMIEGKEEKIVNDLTEVIK